MQMCLEKRARTQPTESMAKLVGGGAGGRMVGRRGEAVELEEPIVSLPSQYTKHPLLRCESGEGRRE